MLKAHQACIDLSKNVLRIQGREVQFLSEHELPDKARNPAELPEGQGPGSSPGTPSSSSNSPSSFPGGGRALGSAPAPVTSARPPAQSRSSSSTHSEKNISILMDLGATREVAISTLDAAGGNIDVAASLLF
jgi:DNA damage-inducible protein 1